MSGTFFISLTDHSLPANAIALAVLLLWRSMQMIGIHDSTTKMTQAYSYSTYLSDYQTEEVVIDGITAANELYTVKGDGHDTIRPRS